VFPAYLSVFLRCIYLSFYLIVYSESTIITSPPSRQNESRKPLPIATVQFGVPRIPGASSFVPGNGLDFLYGVPSVHIEQTFELHQYSGSSENRFTVRGPTNETLYAASETSKPRDRLFLGALRPFSMHLIDKTHQEALLFRRKLAFGLFCCQPQCIEVISPPGDLLGKVKETFSLFNAEFVIEDSYGNIIYQIEGPPKLMCFCNSEELHLKVLSPDFVSQQGSITRIWNTDISAFTQNVYFAETNLDVKLKALFLGAAVLMEYMYFQSKCSCCC